jgi:hypothetical protein
MWDNLTSADTKKKVKGAKHATLEETPLVIEQLNSINTHQQMRL